MSEVANNKNKEQSYNAEGATPSLDKIISVACILLPRGIVTAGYNSKGGILSIRCNEYSANLPVWMEGFYEEQFDNDILLQSKKTKTFFVADDRALVIPKVLYNKVDSVSWMNKIEYTGNSEVVETYLLKAEDAYYMYVWPLAIKNLVARYFEKSEIQPLAACQFGWEENADHFLLCTLTADRAYTTLFSKGSLLWHQVFEQQTAEDIAYEIKLVCKQHKIDSGQLLIECNTATPEQRNVIKKLAGYFPKLSDIEVGGKEKEKKWASTIDLLQQVYGCV